jgi:hypothetical protein
MKIMTRVGDLVQSSGDGRTGRVLGRRTIGWLGDVVCGLHRARVDKELRFLCCASKPRSTVFSGLASKSLEQFVSSLASKPLGQFSLVWPQNRW